jgi:hypothetical protein
MLEMLHLEAWRHLFVVQSSFHPEPNIKTRCLVTSKCNLIFSGSMSIFSPSTWVALSWVYIIEENGRIKTRQNKTAQNNTCGSDSLSQAQYTNPVHGSPQKLVMGPRHDGVPTLITEQSCLRSIPYLLPPHLHCHFCWPCSPMPVGHPPVRPGAFSSSFRASLSLKKQINTQVSSYFTTLHINK